MIDLVERHVHEVANACAKHRVARLEVFGSATRPDFRPGDTLWELKTRSRGGPKGGARVYFAFTGNGEVLVINAEVKDGDAPSAAKITEAAAITLAYAQGRVRLQGARR